MLKSTTKYMVPEVKLLNMFDERKRSWNISRPYLNPEDIKLEDLESMDLAVSAACVYFFYVKSSILFRDLLFTIRPLQPWARSNRTIPFDTDNLFLSVESREYDETLQRRMDFIYKALEEGHPQDYVKDYLPMACQTEFTFYMDDRELVVFLKTLRETNTHLFNVYGKRFLEAIGRDETYLDKRRCKTIKGSLQFSKADKDNLDKPAVNVGDMYYFTRTMTASLMAQFIRIHFATIHNSLWNIVDENLPGYSESNMQTMLCNDHVNVAIYINREAYDKILGVRSCWFAKMDKDSLSSWSTVIGGDVKAMTLPEFVAHLPCKGNGKNCGILKDMMERVNCKEVNLPCPLLCQCKDLVDIRKEKYGSNSSIMEKWGQIKIRNNPENPYFQTYIKCLKELGNGSHEWDIPRKRLLFED